MISRPLAVALLAAGCLTAAAAGSYVAGRQNTAPAAAVQPAASAPAAVPAQPVSETETVVEPRGKKPSDTVLPSPAPVEAPPEPGKAPRTRPSTPVTRRAEPAVAPSVPQVRNANRARSAERPAEQTRPSSQPVAQNTVPASQPTIEVARSETPAPASVPQFEEIVIPASSVIGLEIETSISSEAARVEDRVDGRVTRDVFADGRLAIPAGSRVVGAVTLVERGGKIKERARLGVRFHTLVLGDGRQVNLRTDTIYREGESVSAESSKKIGGAAIGGAVLGAIMGGGKGAVLGGAAGAAGGTAVVMAGGRNPATLPGGTVVTARVASPVTIEVEKR